MRLIGRIKGEKEAFTFHTFLKSEGIENSLESGKEDEFMIWIMNEDDADAAVRLLEAFQKDPEDPRFKKEPEKESELFPGKTDPSRLPGRRPMPVKATLTRLVILLCALLFFLNYVQLAQLSKQKSAARFFNFTPLFLNLAYDIPKNMPEILEFFQQHPTTTPEEFEKLSSGAAYKELEKNAGWGGLYEIVLKWPETKEELKESMFNKIREGQVWRLFTPCLLHGGLLHILFNMLWLWILGKQIEERIKIWQYVAITLIIGVVSNTAQYLMSGPLFIGYSGIICGLAGFIWMRQLRAPWEGYPLQRGTIIFLLVFIVGMFGIQLVSFFLVRYGIANFPMNIANTAHIVGGCTGLLLGRVPLFSKGSL